MHESLERLTPALDRRQAPLPSSSLYAWAALDLGLPYINFTPSLGASVPALQELAQQRRAVIAGKDGKTGETLMKSVLAPMFAARNWQLLSWVGHNIFGNRDGKVLDDPNNKASKIRTKDQVISSIVGYKPQTLVSIEYIDSLDDWKTAWNHIHFAGFLGTKMTLQFIWQGCDSILAGPLVLDLARLALFVAAPRRGRRAAASWLASSKTRWVCRITISSPSSPCSKNTSEIQPRITRMNSDKNQECSSPRSSVVSTVRRRRIIELRGLMTIGFRSKPCSSRQNSIIG